MASIETFREDLFERYVVLKWRAIRAGEFVLGYENESGIHPEGPPAPLGPNGTFMVYRKLEQHVKRFRDHMESEAVRLGFDQPTGKGARGADRRPLAGRHAACAPPRRPRPGRRGGSQARERV